MNTEDKKKRIISGAQPTGMLHIGNYVGAISQWVKYQKVFDSMFCVADLHTLTASNKIDPRERLKKANDMVALYIACGIDPNGSVVFIQSHIAEHSELFWVLNCITPTGWLERMTQYKSKSKFLESVNAGLLNYPVLMAADILLYDVDFVPVGDDQKQHIEITCSIADRFNKVFGTIFKQPKELMKKVGARIMDLSDPLVKMSKSSQKGNLRSSIGLLDSEKCVRKAIMTAMTDSESEINFEKMSPGINNLLTLHSSLSGLSFCELEQIFSGKKYGFLKKEVFSVVMEALIPIQSNYNRISKEKSYLVEVASIGAEKAKTLANFKMLEVRKIIGLI